jgi:hypothetical protein
LHGQYAIGFLAAVRSENHGAMQMTLDRWIRHAVATNVTVSDVVWRVDGETFTVEALCRFPNALWNVGSGQYIRFDRVFDRLLPQTDPGVDSVAAFYYPGYARVDVDLAIPEFLSPSGEGEFRWQIQFALPPGPFDAATRPGFVQKYRSAAEQSFRSIRLKRKG